MDLRYQESSEGESAIVSKNPTPHFSLSPVTPTKSKVPPFPSFTFSHDLEDPSGISHKTTELPTLGEGPQTTFCSFCKEIVHTKVHLYNPRIPQPVLAFAEKICCNSPRWLNRMKVHSCLRCTLVLGKV